MPFHAQRQRFQILEGQPGLERLHDGADELGGVPADIFHQRFRTDHGPAQHAGIARKELRNGKQHDIRPERHWLLQRGGRRGVVDHQWHALGMRHVGDGPDVCDEQTGIAGRLDPNQPGAPIDSLRPAIGVVRGVHEAELHATALGENRRRLLVALTENIEAGDDIVARAGDRGNQVKQRLRSRRSGHGRLAAFQRGQPFLQHAHRRRLATPIDVVGEAIETLVRVGHRLDEGRHERSELGRVAMGIKPRMEGTCIEAQPGIRAAGGPGFRIVNPTIAHEERLLGVHRGFYSIFSCVATCGSDG